MFSPPLHQFTPVCDDVAGSLLQRCSMDSAWAESSLYSIVHGAEVPMHSQQIDGCSERDSASNHW